MPSIQVKLVEQAFTPAQRLEVVSKLTHAIVSIKGVQPVTLVVIEEVQSGELEIGGKPTRTDAVRTLAASKS